MFRNRMQTSNKNKDEKLIETNIEENIKRMKEIYNFPINKDFNIREFYFKKTKIKGALFYYTSIISENTLNTSILRPLLAEGDNTDISSIVSVGKLEKVQSIKNIVSAINSGNVVLIIDGQEIAHSFQTSDFKHRSIEKAQNESLIKGPKEAFTESLIVNLSLIRKKIRDNNLIFETMIMGERSQNQLGLLYIKNLANENIIQNVKDRIKNIDIDNLKNVEMLEQFIEERPYSLFPTILYTERPDRAGAFLEDGYIVLIMENSSACLILPVTFWSFFHSPEDHYLRFLFGNFSRFIRAIAFFITLFISASYIAITSYHSEMLPPDLLLAIANTREKVPFPVFFEVLIMEFAFELIREAGLRIPSPLGPTIGIVGALILGQAAVDANIISPIMVIVAALSGLSSFAISDISFNYTIRLSRFIFIAASGLYGIFGMVSVFILWLMYMVSMRSFGVPFLSPMAPKYISSKDTIFRKLLQNEKWRPSYLKPKDLIKQNE